MSKWQTTLPKIVAIGAFLGWLVGMLAFFGVNAKTIRDQMTAHYVFLLTAVGCFALFVRASYVWWKNSRISADNAQRRIRSWLDTYNYSHRIVQWDSWHFGFEITLPRGPLLFIARPKVFGGDHLQFIGRIKGVSPQYRTAFDLLSPAEREQFYGQLELETARAKIFFHSDATLDEVSIEKWMPITSKLTASDVVNAIAEIEFSARIIWKTVSLRFGGKPELTPPSLTPDTEASPPSPA